MCGFGIFGREVVGAAVVGVAGCDGFERGLEPDIGLDAIHRDALEHRGQAVPSGDAFAAACEERVFSR